MLTVRRNIFRLNRHKCTILENPSAHLHGLPGVRRRSLCSTYYYYDTTGLVWSIQIIAVFLTGDYYCRLLGPVAWRGGLEDGSHSQDRTDAVKSSRHGLIHRVLGRAFRRCTLHRSSSHRRRFRWIVDAPPVTLRIYGRSTGLCMIAVVFACVFSTRGPSIPSPMVFASVGVNGAMSVLCHCSAHFHGWMVDGGWRTYYGLVWFINNLLYFI